MLLNYLAVLVVTVVGFLLGWLWYSPLCLAKPWMAEMKFTKESMEGSKPQMPLLFGKCLLYTFLSTFALAALISSHGSENWMKGAEFGLFVGALVVGMRLLNGSLWEQRSLKLPAINVGHEIVLFTVQGTILGVWR